MRQGKALVLGILCTAMAVSFYADSQTTLMWAFVASSALFLGLWFYRYQRDKNIIAQARQERLKPSQTTPTLPPMESKGSRRLFVPPPLN